jgi:Phage tail assembly chaperone
MLKIDRTPQFQAVVNVTRPDGEAESFTITFNVLAISRYTAADFSDAEGSAAFLTEAIAGFAGVVDEKGKELAFTAELVAKVLDQPDLRPLVMKAYIDGLQKATRGN